VSNSWANGRACESPTNPVRPVPSLDELATDPHGAAALSPEVARALTLRCAAVLTALATVAARGPSPAGSTVEDRLLTVEEAAQKLGTSRDYLYRNAKRLPFTVRLGGRLRFSAHGVDRFIRSRQAR
jgi:excisionase family DNA binding protein